MIFKLRILTLLALVTLTSCEEPRPTADPTHSLVGAWLATDGTIFDFRSDGTFHGIDYAKREIWGNWIELSPARIGFQSLLHTTAYDPQYAIINQDDPDSMDYIYANGNAFIPAQRISVESARSAIELIVEPQIHHPKIAPE